MYAASVVYCVRQILFGEDLSCRVTPPLRHLLARMPEQIAVDHGNGVEKIGRAALANEFTPLRGIFALPGQGRAVSRADKWGEPLGVVGEDSVANQCGNALARSAAV